MNVETILSAKGRSVVTIEPDATVAAAVRLFVERRIGAVVVVGPDRRIAGILSERDVVRMLAERGAAALDLPVAKVMTRNVETCSPGDSIASIMERITTGKFRHVPVLEQGRLAGIVSIGDLVKHRLEEMEREQEALREYIQTA